MVFIARQLMRSNRHYGKKILTRTCRTGESQLYSIWPPWHFCYIAPLLPVLAKYF